MSHCSLSHSCLLLVSLSHSQSSVSLSSSHLPSSLPSRFLADFLSFSEVSLSLTEVSTFRLLASRLRSRRLDVKVIAIQSGLDMYAYNSDSKLLQLVETKKLNVSWYAYTHESRLVLLASGMQCRTFHGFQISSADIVRLPRLEMVMAKSDANNKPVLAAEDICIVTV